MTEEINNNQNLPPVSPQDIPEVLQGDNWFNVDVAGDFLPFDKPYRPPRYTLERNGVPFADVGELHIISGKPGHGKTGLMSQLMATILCGQHGNTLRRDVPHKVMEGDNVIEKDIGTRILYIDTEQGEDDTIAIKNRVCTMAGIDYTKPCDKFSILRLRDTEEAVERWRKILKAVWLKKPTDIFLDGMLDIVKDYNDQVECQPIVRKCMKLATYYDASLWAVLHENPMAEKLVGTLGSITQRKVSEIFTVIKIKQDDLKPADKRADMPNIYFRVKQVKARGKDVGDWYFEYITNAGGWGQPVELGEIKEKPATTFTPEQIIQFITDKQDALNWPATRTEIYNKIFIPFGIVDTKEQKTVMEMAINRRCFIEQSKDEMKEGQKVPRLKLNREIILPF